MENFLSFLYYFPSFDRSYIAQVSFEITQYLRLEFLIHLSPPLKCWDYRLCHQAQLCGKFSILSMSVF